MFAGSLPAYWDFHEARVALLNKNGVGAQPGVCQAANSLVQCTSGIPTWDYGCLTAFGVNISDARDYYTDLAVGGYACSDGYTTLITNFDCIATVRSGNSDIDNCSSTMNQQIADGMDICQAENNWMMCESAVYTKVCNFNVGVFMCGSNRAGINSASKYCDEAGRLMQCPPYQP